MIKKFFSTDYKNPALDETKKNSIVPIGKQKNSFRTINAFP